MNQTPQAFQLTTARKAVTKRTDVKRADKDVQKEESLLAAGGNVNSSGPMRVSMEVPQKAKIWTM